MKTHAPAPSQFSLSEILFATVLTFIGMSVLNSVTFTDNPALGCVVALIATIAGGLVVTKISTPNSSVRWGAMPIIIPLSTILLALVVASGIRGVQFLLAIGFVFGVPIVAGIVIGMLMFPKCSFTHHQVWKRFGLILMTTVFTTAFGSCFILNTFFVRRCGCSNETAAAAACKAYAEAQEIYRRPDYDGDGVLEYAQSMYGANSLLERKKDTGDLLIIDPAFAEAAWEHPRRQPKAGYFYKVLHGGGCATGSYKDDAGNQTIGFAMLAVPAVYDGTGRTSFMINNTGTIYQKDLGPNTLSIAAGITDFALDPTWIPTE